MTLVRGSMVALLALVLVVVVAGRHSFGPHSQPGASSILRFAIAGDENNLTPYTVTYRSGVTQDVLNLVYDTLLYSPNDREPQAWLARSVEASEDRRQWTFSLRDDVLWHDGETFTAEDVRFTFAYFAEHEQGRYSHHVNDLPFVEQVEVLDPLTVRITCREPCPTFPIDPGADLPILPRHVWSAIASPHRFTDELPIGSGPFRLVEHRPGRFYRLEANAVHFAGPPTVDEIHLPIIRESAAMFQALAAGEVDAVARTVPPETLPRLERAGLKTLHAPIYASFQINMNTQREPFDQPRFRKALVLAVDTERLVETLLLGYGAAGRPSVVDPDSPLADRDLEPEFDPERSAALLDTLGFEDRDGDGWREHASGAPLTFEILVSSLESREVRAAQIVARDLARVGIGARVRPLDPATVNSRRRPPRTPDRVGRATRTGDYDMYVSSYIGGHFHFDPDGLYYFFRCPGEGGFSAYVTGYCNPEVDALVDRAAHLDYEERIPFLRAVQRILFDTPPMISLYFPDGLFAYRPEAYDGWVHETGHGIFHKRSFLPDASAAGARHQRQR